MPTILVYKVKTGSLIMQVYAPDDDDEDGRRIIKDTCYHRTIFVFTCTTADCYTKNSNRNFVVFRCQVPSLRL